LDRDVATAAGSREESEDEVEHGTRLNEGGGGRVEVELKAETASTNAPVRRAEVKAKRSENIGGEGERASERHCTRREGEKRRDALEETPQKLNPSHQTLRLLSNAVVV
jgi:hypothetical protein